jgi:hypothetical protein
MYICMYDCMYVSMYVLVRIYVSTYMCYLSVYTVCLYNYKPSVQQYKLTEH